MTKQALTPISSIDPELMKEAKKADWKYVRDRTKLSRQTIHQHKVGRSSTKKLEIEEALAKSIANRKKVEAKHKKRIEAILEEADQQVAELASSSIANKLSRKHGNRK